MIAMEENTTALACEKHGAQTAKIWRLTDSADWSPARCPECLREQEEAELARKQEQERKAGVQARERAIARHIGECMVPLRFAGDTFDTYHPTCPKGGAALETCRRYAEGFATQSAGLILCGLAGTGKTHLACSIVSHVIRHHGKSARFMKTAQAVRVVKETYSRNSSLTEQEAITSFRRFDLLVLDEVGVQFGSEAEKNILFEIINERYENLLPTILISNLAVPALESFVGERVIDRMRENGGRVIVFDWPSYRNNPPA
ncbi:ATP-binding protein [Limnoglobus roseus]|uniref:ATPase AAA n=1 Tax=Limnoglobus roseus TaxID=2598579 RepID=A0A5C1AKK2_9BACT|nr:ATP-binding protein [Limnoglobus roseus]QEL18733.1 ATPase AAA [Limnoglobus roseus]